VIRVLVLGGTGFLGPEVVRHLIAAGCAVTVFHRGPREADLPAVVEHVHGDRDHIGAFVDEFRRIAPDVVVDMKPMTEAHAQGLVAAFAGLVERVVIVSSTDVYRAYGRLNLTEPGPPDPVPLTEDAPLRERLYADRDAKPHDRAGSLDLYDKLLVERAVAAEPRFAAAILRLGMVHGPRSYRHFPYVRRMNDRRPGIILAQSWARWRGTLAYSEDVGAAIALAAMRADARGPYNVGDARPTPMAELATAIGSAADWTGRIVVVADAELPEPMRPGAGLSQELILDTSRIRRELGYKERVSRDEALRRTVQWMRQHPPGPDDPMGRLEVDYDAEDAILRAH
jgi:nucleoside-diphosphate-sugar epimerase